MLRTLKLLLPAIIPSWRFFDIIAPSPRIEFTLLTSKNEPSLENREWQEFRVRPARLPFLQMLGHMFWNPQRNETLFIVSCAERLLQQSTQHSEDEILKRIVRDIESGALSATMTTANHLQFRLLLVERQGSKLQKIVVFHSHIQSLPMQGVS